MLGYVKIDKGELKVREYEVYCGYYCGICKSIGRRYGQLPRMALSYDAAFLAILLASLSDAPDAPAQEHCVVHHIKKKTLIYNQAVDYAGDVMLLLAWYKLLDDVKDEHRLYARATMVMLRRIYQRLQSQYPDLCRGIEENLTALATLEAAKCDSIDRAADAFSRIMEIIFQEGVRALYGEKAEVELTGGKEPEINTEPGVTEGAPPNPEAESEMLKEHKTGAERSGNKPPDSKAERKMPKTKSISLDALIETTGRIGWHLGKWIYLIDAVDDIEENLESGSYNPLLYRFSYDAAGETPQEFRNRIEPELRFNLFHYLAIASNSLQELPLQKNQGILENIVYLGLYRKTEEIITHIEKKKRI